MTFSALESSITLNMTKVVNIKENNYDSYIGRAGRGRDGYYGNPHPIGYCKLCKRIHDREDSLKEYRIYFNERIEKDVMFKANILLLKGQTLGCFCKPQNCHGDIIADYLNNL